MNKPALARGFGAVTSVVLAVGLASAGSAAAQPHHFAKQPSPSAFVANNTLILRGTAGNDVLFLSQATDPNQLLVDFDDDGIGTFDVFDRADFTAIDVDLDAGNDVFAEITTIASDEKLTVRGGRGNDTIQTGDGNDVIFGDRGDDLITSGNGDDLVFGGSGDDFVDGGVGTDIAFLGHGDDIFQWDPGEGSDIVDGGHNTDTMLFNGSGANETVSLSANGHRSIFLRDPGAIRMDMDQIEQLQFNALGGTDTITVNDMTGTGFRRADFDLRVPGGQPDGVLDTVIVNGSPRADHVNVTGDGSTVDVAGLRTETTITGADTRDQLAVRTQDGNDRVNVDASATALIGVTTDLGAGQH